MPVFAYRARTASGRAEHGIVDAESLRGAWQQLRARGVFPTELTTGEEAPTHGHVGLAELAASTAQLASLVSAGVTVADALEGVAEDTPVPALRAALVRVRARLREGASFADALATRPDVFPPLHRELVRAGEASGALAEVLERLARDGAAAVARRARLRAALLYPAIMLATTTVVLAFLLVWVVPQVSRLFAETGTSLPLATRALVAVAAGLRASWWLWLLAGALGAVAARRWYATPSGRHLVDGLVLRAPVAGPVVGALATGRVARTLATLLAHGVPLADALALAASTAGNVRIAQAIAEVRHDVMRGRPLAPALGAHGLFGGSLCRLVATGERTGTLATAFAHAADAQGADVERALATATGLVEPVLVVVMGGAVLLLVLAVLVPILTLNPLGAHG
jgi:general secretion pathway protein F